MKYLLIAILIVSTMAAFVGVAALWQLQTREPSPQDEQVTVLKNQIAVENLRLQQEKEAQKTALLTAKLAKERAEQERQARIQARPEVEESRAFLARFWYLLPVIGSGALVLCGAVGSLVYAFTRKTLVKTPFAETYVRPKVAAELVRESFKVSSAAEMAKVAALLKEASDDKFQEVVKGVSVMKGFLPKGHAEPALPVQVTPVIPAIPAFVGQVFLSQCRQDSDYEDSYVCFGRNYDDGGLVQWPLEEIQSLVKNGLQGQGKTVATLLEIYSALYRKYVKGENLRIFLIDKHAGFPQSLSNRIETLLPGGLSLFDGLVHGADIADNGALLAFLTEQLEECKQRQTNGMAEASFDVIICDEYTETVTDSKDGQAIERIVKQLLNYRKALKYMSVILFESSKNKNSAKGNSVARMGKSKMMFAGDTDDAGRFIGWKNAENADGLEKGQCLLRLADVKEVVKIQLAQVSDIDFAAFARFVTLPEEAQPVTADEQEGSHPLPRNAGEAISSFIARQKAADANYSLSEFARHCEVNKGLVSRAIKDDPTVSRAAVDAMLNYIAEQEKKIVPFTRKAKTA